MSTEQSTKQQMAKDSLQSRKNIKTRFFDHFLRHGTIHSVPSHLLKMSIINVTNIQIRIH